MRAWGWFAAWALVGVGAALGVAGLLTIGLPVLLVTVVAAVLLVRRDGASRSAWGIGVGVALLLLWLAWLNRHGPGEYCTSTAVSSECADQYAPWPFVLVALVVLGVAVTGQVVSGRRARA